MVVLIVCIVIALYIFGKEAFLASRSAVFPKANSKQQHRYAILIPARDESKVIEALLISIEKQSMPVSSCDVYVIVEDKNDKTVEIVKKHKMQIVYRQDLTKKRKGYALDDAIQEIRKQEKQYDAYFIFDADNVLDPKFLEEMTTSIDAGYDIGLGYRNTKNGNDSVYAAVSSLTFSMINTLGNDNKCRHHKTLTISGTGFYILGKWIDKWKGYPFVSLTEDYELTMYATLHDLTTTYNKKAIFYDEQPNSYQATITQRTRWVRGYFDTRRQYMKVLKAKMAKKDKNYPSVYEAVMGIKPYLVMVVGVVSTLIWQFYNICLKLIAKKPFMAEVMTILGIFLAIYICLFLVTYVMLKKEKKVLNLKRSMKFKALVYNPIFLATYVHCLVLAFTQKEITWEKITHDRSLTIDKEK